MATEILKLTKDCPEATIKSYFQGILKLTRENKEFPVDLDDVWMLAYAEKGVAVKALKNNFIENIDFITKSEKPKSNSLDQNVKRDLGKTQKIDLDNTANYTQTSEHQFFNQNIKKANTSDKEWTKDVFGEDTNITEIQPQGADNQFLRKNAENSKTSWGGQNRIKYHLSVSCLEFFIARKIRAVFEVYRQVFHKVAEKPQKAIVHKPTSKEMLRLTAESTREEIEAYFLEIKMKCADNNKFPVPVDEVWGMRFSAKRRVMDKLLGRNGQPNIFVYDKDYTQKGSERTHKDALGKYYMSIKTFERIMVEPVQLYREIFEKVFSSDYSIVPKTKSGKQTALQRSQAKTNEQKIVLLDSIIKLYEINKVAPSNTLEEIMENMMKISKEL